MSKLQMNKLTLFAVCVASVAAFAGGEKKVNNVHVLPSDIAWAQPFGPKGPSFGFVEGKYGDKHPASFFAKLSAGGDSGWHFHNEEYKAVVIQGTFTEQQIGEANEIQLPVGSYFTQPGKIVHRNGCLKGTDCIVYVHFDKGADSTPTTPEGKPVK
jgi:hypothetical protein